MKSKQVLDVQQMQHLQELGLKLDYNTMLSWIIDERRKDKPLLCISSEVVDYVDFGHYCLPAYTLQDVLDALTRWDINDGFCPRITVDLSEKLIRYHYKDKERVGMVMKSFDGNGTGCLIDAAYEMLCWAIEKKIVETNKKNE